MKKKASILIDVVEWVENTSKPKGDINYTNIYK
jgi:hypothetical protein